MTWWSHRRQLLGRAGAAPLDTLKRIVAVYSTHPTAPLALLARCADHTRAEFQNLEETRKMIRLPAMRGSAFLLLAETAARIFAATRQPLEKHAGSLAFGGLDFESYARLTPQVLDCLKTPSTPAKLRACGASDEDVYMVARVLAREGRVLKVGHSLRTDQLEYVAAAAWLGRELEDIDRTEALAWLANEYLRAFGPARVADFAWWAGVPRRVAASALAPCNTVESDGYLILEQDAAAFECIDQIDPKAMDVLPKWDSYTMGYAPDGRQRFVDDRFLCLAYTAVVGSPGATSGDGNPLILRGGRAVASWSHRFVGNRLIVSVKPFARAALSDDIFDAVGQQLSASSVDVTRQDQAAAAT